MKGFTYLGRIGNTGMAAALYLALSGMPNLAVSSDMHSPAVSGHTDNTVAVMNHANNMDHSMHTMDHNAHGQPMPMTGEHAQHQQMMQRQGYARSVNDYALSNLALVDMDGKATTLQQELDTPMPVLLNFIYTTCTSICPVLSATFSQVQQDMGSEAQHVRMISITIDPEQDTPEQLRSYAERFHAGPQWRFLTGELDSIIAVQKVFDIYRGSKTNHEPITLLRASGASEWVRVEGLASAAEIMKEFNALASTAR